VSYPAGTLSNVLSAMDAALGRIMCRRSRSNPPRRSPPDRHIRQLFAAVFADIVSGFLLADSLTTRVAG
jgi:hypothetical protein